VGLHLAEVTDLPFEDREFDKVFSIHSIYFWRYPVAALREIWRVLQTDGLLAITMLPKDRWNEGNPNVAVGTTDCVPYSGPTLVSMLEEAGFQDNQIVNDEDQMKRSNYTITGIKR
jgi:SAM-dependent methyltransferase